MRPLLAPPYPSPHIYIGVWPLAAAVLVATRRMAPARPPVVLLPRPLRASGRGTQGVVPVLRAGRGPLTHDGLGTRIRLLDLLPQLIAARVVVEAAMHQRAPGQARVDLPAREIAMAVVG